MVARIYKMLPLLVLVLLFSGCGVINNVKYNVGGSKDVVNDINEISQSIMKANIKIIVTFGNKQGNTVATKQGSGFIYEGAGNSYSALSNAHVFDGDGSDIKMIEIYDYIGDYVYSGKLIDADYDDDVAVVSFIGLADRELNAVTFSDKLPGENEIVYAVGNPLGQSNSILAGTYIGKYSNVSDLNFDFDILCASIPIDHGNSGGMLLDDDLKVIGMTTVQLSNTEGTRIFCGSIPVEILSEYIQ